MKILAWVAPATWPAVVDAATRLPADEITLVAVADSAQLPGRPSPLGSGLRRGQAANTVRRSIEELLDEALARMTGDDARVHTQLLSGPASREIVQAAQAADVLVIARDGDRSRLGPKSLGKDTRFVVDHAPCTVVLVWPGDIPPLGTLPPPPPR
ncbi:universal stress protein [Propionimicrobium sp. PCR01-08-3]|uniref:universal stress protein n=1 Tax=Propionimicrobium sp. PCR01-08-3 TaxID=3052086 RepID=UPI00255CAA4B|nr:universal stress protein [Propionimicrobium sp. PCR01-08-3]WIY82417.1 universal stress protein [Propionimicrobium sp. PCR01-08-3]